VLIVERMAKDDSDQGAVLQAAARLARSGGSPELAIYGVPGLDFQRDFHQRHRCDAANPFCSPWDDGGR
jgi:hypothetical protein